MAPPPAVSRHSSFECRASLSESERSIAAEPSSSSSAVLGDEVVGEASGPGDADEVLQIIAEKAGGRGGVVGMSDCRSIMAAALERGNVGLALSVFYAMRATFNQGPGEDDTYVNRWRWSRPDVCLYAPLVQGLAASLRVSDALSVIDIICQVGVSPDVEDPFGKVVRCPSCMIAVAVAQPQDGIQVCYQSSILSTDYAISLSKITSIMTSSDKGKTTSSAETVIIRRVCKY